MKADIQVLGKSKIRPEHITQGRIEMPDDGDAIDEKPRSVYEVVTRQMLEQVKADVSEVKSRVNTLVWLVIGAMLIELVMRVVK